jgi:sortase (surface protein transpeptidase)
MSGQTSGRRTASNILIAIGAVVLLGAAGYFLWGQYQGVQLRAELQQTPAPSLTPASVSSTGKPSITVVPPTPVPSPTPASTVVAATEPTIEPAQTPTALASTATPQPEPSAIPTTALAGPPVRLAIPELGIDVPVMEMTWEVVQAAAGLQTRWVIPENEAGHHIDSAQLGQTGNLVISGHNNIYGRVFERISLAWPGKSTRVDDITERSEILNGRTIQLYNQAGQRFDYAITDFLRLKDTGIPLAQRVENARFMRPTDDTRVTLVTCWPPWSNTHRLIVIARPAPQP